MTWLSPKLRWLQHFGIVELRTRAVIINMLHIMFTLILDLYKVTVGLKDMVIVASHFNKQISKCVGLVFLPSFSGRGHNESISTTQTGSSPQGRVEVVTGICTLQPPHCPPPHTHRVTHVEKKIKALYSATAGSQCL